MTAPSISTIRTAKPANASSPGGRCRAADASPAASAGASIRSSIPASCTPASISRSPRGTPIYAAGDGIVEKAGWSSGYGNFTLIKHVNGYETGYGHQSKIVVKPGDKVRQGQIIGYVGSTGNSTGNHLHFEIRINGNFVDPLSVKLPRDHALPAQDDGAFKQTIAQINDLMKRDGEAAPIQVAAAATPATNG